MLISPRNNCSSRLSTTRVIGSRGGIAFACFGAKADLLCTEYSRKCRRTPTSMESGCWVITVSSGAGSWVRLRGFVWSNAEEVLPEKSEGSSVFEGLWALASTTRDETVKIVELGQGCDRFSALVLWTSTERVLSASSKSRTLYFRKGSRLSTVRYFRKTPSVGTGNLPVFWEYRALEKTIPPVHELKARYGATR